MFQRAFVVGLLIAPMISCGSSTSGNTGSGSNAVSVETYNVYVGFDLKTLLDAPTQEALVEAVTAGYEQATTQFAKRKESIADEIARTQPDLIGLQEVATYYVQTPPVAQTLATNVTLDFLQELLAALESRGQHYYAAATVKDSDQQLPGLVNGALSDVRLTDSDVILARTGMAVSNAQGHNYANNLKVTLFGTTVELPRGWVSVEAQSGTSHFRFMSTHLETEDAAPIQLLQATELLGATVLGSTTFSTILVGDFNSRADDKGTATHQVVLHADLTDAWALAHPSDPGFTCCQAPNLTNPTSMLDARIDYIFFRGVSAVTNVQLVGDAQVSTGLWPSDHAGLFGALALSAPVSSAPTEK